MYASEGKGNDWKNFIEINFINLLYSCCRYRGPEHVSRLGEILGRASILICTECGSAIHVLDAEAHSLNCKATPRFPLPSQVGYHSDSQQQQPLAIAYPSPSVVSPEGSDRTTPDAAKQKRNSRRRIKIEQPENEPVHQPKVEVSSDVEDVFMKSPTNTYQPSTPVMKLEATESDDFQSSPEKSIKKKVKVMLPSLDSPRGLRTLLPGIF